MMGFQFVELVGLFCLVAVVNSLPKPEEESTQSPIPISTISSDLCGTTTMTPPEERAGGGYVNEDTGNPPEGGAQPSPCEMFVKFCEDQEKQLNNQTQNVETEAPPGEEEEGTTPSASQCECLKQECANNPNPNPNPTNNAADGYGAPSTPAASTPTPVTTPPVVAGSG